MAPLPDHFEAEIKETPSHQQQIFMGLRDEKKCLASKAAEVRSQVVKASDSFFFVLNFKGLGDGKTKKYHLNNIVLYKERSTFTQNGVPILQEPYGMVLAQ